MTTEEKIKEAIKILEKYVQEKEKEIGRIRNLINQAKGENTLIDKGYFKITSYIGNSNKIKEGRIYRGYTFRNCKGIIRGVIRSVTPNAYFTEKNTSWILSSREEYENQKEI